MRQLLGNWLIYSLRAVSYRYNFKTFGHQYIGAIKEDFI